MDMRDRIERSSNPSSSWSVVVKGPSTTEAMAALNHFREHNVRMDLFKFKCKFVINNGSISLFLTSPISAPMH